jgi:plastocyanin
MGMRIFSASRILLAVVALLGVTWLVACGGQSTTGTTSAKEVQVKIVEQNDQYAFQPATLTIAKGTKVTWTNTSDAPHTVTSDSNAFTASSSLQQNQTFSMTFNTAGTYAYHCSIHPYMKATITVTS